MDSATLPSPQPSPASKFHAQLELPARERGQIVLADGVSAAWRQTAQKTWKNGLNREQGRILYQMHGKIVHFLSLMG